MEELDRARARYVELLLREQPDLNDQIKDLARVFGVLMAAEQRRHQATEGVVGVGAPALVAVSG